MRIVSEAVRVFIAGAFGGLVNSLAVWGFGALGVTALLGADLAPRLTFAWLLPRLFFGGLWALLFFIPPRVTDLYKKGLIISIAPSAYMLLVVFPKLGKGMLGLELGGTVPLFVFFFNALWGLAAAFWLRNVHK